MYVQFGFALVFVVLAIAAFFSNILWPIIAGITMPFRLMTLYVEYMFIKQRLKVHQDMYATLRSLGAQHGYDQYFKIPVIIDHMRDILPEYREADDTVMMKYARDMNLLSVAESFENKNCEFRAGKRGSPRFMWQQKRKYIISMCYD